MSSCVYFSCPLFFSNATRLCHARLYSVAIPYTTPLNHAYVIYRYIYLSCTCDPLIMVPFSPSSLRWLGALHSIAYCKGSLTVRHKQEYGKLSLAVTHEDLLVVDDDDDQYNKHHPTNRHTLHTHTQVGTHRGYPWRRRQRNTAERRTKEQKRRVNAITTHVDAVADPVN